MGLLMSIITLLAGAFFFQSCSNIPMVNGRLLPIIDEQAVESDSSNNSTARIQTYIVHVQKPKGTKYSTFRDRKRWYESFLPNTTLPTGGRRMLYAYRRVISGFAARLTPEEVDAMESLDGFVTAYPETLHSAQTTYTPDFLGLRSAQLGAGFWSQYNLGEGKIIGVIDTGIKPDHPSFRDDNMPPPPTKWRAGCWASRYVCNNKLIGATGFRYGLRHSPIDDNGHGTHVASTAAGNFVDNAEVLGFAKGRASGTAPRAHLAVYKVLYDNGKGQAFGTDSDILAGIDQAIYDEVDVLSMSLGSSTRPLYQSPVAIASFSATVRGIFPCAAAANDGPANSVIANDAPWIMTVGASTVGRQIMAAVKLGDGKELPGESAYQPSTFSPAYRPLVYPFQMLGTPDVAACNVDLTQFNVQGKIVMCVRAIIGDTDRGNNVRRAGGAGMISMNVRNKGDWTGPELQVLPASHVGNRAARKIVSYYQSNNNPTAAIVFKDTQYGVKPYPAVATFSSRGPSLVNGGIIKPDVIAPGVNIVAAWPWDISPNPSGTSSTFNFESGTSMATPHVSGIVALIQRARPNWSIAAIKSAIMTTAYTLDSDGNPITDQYEDQYNSPASVFARGSGHVDPRAAIDPGLIYDLNYYDYVRYLCGMGLSDRQVTTIARNSVQCASVPALSPQDLNYPSFIGYLGYSTPSMTVRRTVTNVGDANSVYTIGFDEPAGVNVDVYPPTLQFSQAGERQSFQVTFSLKGAPSPSGQVSQGQLYWDSGKYLTENLPSSFLATSRTFSRLSLHTFRLISSHEILSKLPSQYVVKVLSSPLARKLARGRRDSSKTPPASN